MARWRRITYLPFYLLPFDRGNLNTIIESTGHIFSHVKWEYIHGRFKIVTHESSMV
jgi:hypothetical protein